MPGRLADEAAAKADSDRMGPAAGLELREQVPDMALDCLLREEETNADLTVDEAVGDQLQHFDLAGGQLLLQLLKGSLERNDLRHRGVPACRNRLEASRVLPVAGQDLVALCGVHDGAIGPYSGQL